MKRTGYGVILKELYEEGFQPTEYYSRAKAEKSAKEANRELQRINQRLQKDMRYIIVKFEPWIY